MFLQSIPSKVLLALIKLYTLLSCPFSTLSSLELICYQPHPLFVKHKRELRRIDISDQPLISLSSMDDTEPWLGQGAKNVTIRRNRSRRLSRICPPCHASRRRITRSGRFRILLKPKPASCSSWGGTDSI